MSAADLSGCEKTNSRGDASSLATVRARTKPRLPVVRIGCAGWSIGTAHAAFTAGDGTHLERYARVFNAVEINSSFYRPHRPQTYAKWAQSVPAQFRFSVKMPKVISHAKRLRDCDHELETFLAQATQLGSALGVLLLQLPPSLAFERDLALAFFDALRARHAGPVACEPRHASWFRAAVETDLRDRGITRVAADPAIVPRAAVPGGDRSCEYIRLHGSPRVYYDAYSIGSLARVARHLRRPSAAARERWCIFDNTAHGHAFANALELQEIDDASI